MVGELTEWIDELARGLHLAVWCRRARGSLIIVVVGRRGRLWRMGRLGVAVDGTLGFVGSTPRRQRDHEPAARSAV
jgi:hypothetical protein